MRARNTTPARKPIDFFLSTENCSVIYAPDLS
jgi:hypothetical protein